MNQATTRCALEVGCAEANLLPTPDLVTNEESFTETYLISGAGCVIIAGPENSGNRQQTLSQAGFRDQSPPGVDPGSRALRSNEQHGAPCEAMWVDCQWIRDSQGIRTVLQSTRVSTYEQQSRGHNRHITSHAVRSHLLTRSLETITFRSRLLLPGVVFL